MSPQVRQALLQTCAVLWKRGWPLAPDQGGWPPEAKAALFEAMAGAVASAEGSGTATSSGDGPAVAAAELLCG